MTPLWDKTMITEAASELLELLENRWKLYPQDNKDAIALFTSVVKGEWGEFFDPVQIEHQTIKHCFHRVLELIAPPETILKEEFWDTPAGQLLAYVQYWLYGVDTIPVAEAARMIYGDSTNGSIASTLRLIERNKLQMIHRPTLIMPSRRMTTKTGQGTSRSKLVLLSSVKSFLAERKQVVK